MEHVVTVPSAPFPVAGGALDVHLVPAAHDNLVWLLVDRARGAAAAVDGPSAAPVLDACARLGVRLTAILTTHVHGDHVGLHHELARAGALEGVRVVGCPARADEIPGLTEPVDEGDAVRVGDATLTVWRTDGHQAGHLSYVADGAVFCGDTLFAAGCGRIFEGTPDALFASLMRLASLPPDTRVCCAHEYTLANLAFALDAEPDNAALLARVEAVRALRATGAAAVPSTIAEERATNPFLRPGSPTILARLAEVTGFAGVDPAAAFAALRAWKDGWRGPAG